MDIPGIGKNRGTWDEGRLVGGFRGFDTKT